MQKPIQVQQTFSWSSGQKWFYQGIDLLPQLARTWVLVWVIYALIGSVLYQLDEVLVYMLFGLIAPVITAGIFNACQVAKQHQNGGRPVELSDYFVPWKSQLNPLLALGLVLLSMGFLTESVSQLLQDAIGLKVDEEMAAGELIAVVFKAQIISTVVSIPLLVVAFFSPQLMFFHNQSLINALKGSYVGFVAAWRGLLVLSLMVMGLLFVVFFFGVLISSFLGGVGLVLLMLALMVIFSLNLAAQFAAFDDIFPVGSDEEDHGQSQGDFHSEF